MAYFAIGGVVTQVGQSAIHTFTTVGSSTFTVGIPLYADVLIVAGGGAGGSDRGGGGGGGGIYYSKQFFGMGS